MGQAKRFDFLHVEKGVYSGLMSPRCWITGWNILYYDWYDLHLHFIWSLNVKKYIVVQINTQYNMIVKHSRQHSSQKTQIPVQNLCILQRFVD